MARRRLASRSAAWLVAYPLVAGGALLEPAPVARRSHSGTALLVGVPLALFGYTVGCAVLRHKAYQAPPDSFGLELAALAGVVAPVEELVWGRRVEPRLGIPMTAGLFAAKHVVIDGKWRRAAGLALFWVGLGLIRRRSPKLALGLHVTANAAGVALGHLTDRDSF